MVHFVQRKGLAVTGCTVSTPPRSIFAVPNVKGQCTNYHIALCSLEDWFTVWYADGILCNAHG